MPRAAWLLAASLLAGGCSGSLGVGSGPGADLAVTPPIDAGGGGDGPACEGTARSCGRAGACEDCTGRPIGAACVQGSCGCRDAADCSGGRACMNGLCAEPCSAFSPCARGCCAGSFCAPGTAAAACGTDKAACVDCTQSAFGRACLPGGRCGCQQASDCPPLTACNRAIARCEAACSATQPCSSGCCSNKAGGTCLDGTSNNACGGDGNACTDCTPLGLTCSGIACGCTRAADCPAGKSCDAKTRTCTTACDANQPCNGGCCRAGMCAAGNDNAACGSGGGECAPCGGGTPTCVMGACAARCGGMGDGTCGGGNCCLGGQCVPGNATASCGYAGACADCTGRASGSRCLTPMGSTNWGCGCAAREDCPAANPAGGIGGYACDTNSGSCTNRCGIAGITACNGGCCSGMNGQCFAGNADLACGINGSFCNNCANTCSPGPFCNLKTGACGCTKASGQCNLNVVCAQNNANRYGCNLGTNACCVPGFYNYGDNGNPMGCCSGQSVGGKCVCLTDGVATGNPANPWACCSLEVDVMGRCACLANGKSAELMLGGGGVAAACCSNRLSGVNCVCSPAGGSCQNTSGCCAPLTCTNGSCK